MAGMTVVEAIEVLREFRKLTLGPELSEAIDVISRHFDQAERAAGITKATLAVIPPDELARITNATLAVIPPDESKAT